MKKIIVILIIVALVIVGLNKYKDQVDTQPAQALKSTDSKINIGVKGIELDPGVVIKEYYEGEVPTGSEKRKQDRVWCSVNSDGTVSYGTARWVRTFLFFGHWEVNPGTITMPGNAKTCADFVGGVRSI